MAELAGTTDPAGAYQPGRSTVSAVPAGSAGFAGTGAFTAQVGLS
jgi:hypothetical protein